MRMRLGLLACCTLLAFSTCRKVDFGPEEGIYYRDHNNSPHGGDDSDWKADDDWKAVEEKLFDDLPFNVKGRGTGGYRAMSLYPNPIAPAYRMAYLTADLRATGPVHIKLVMVDKRYRKLAEQTAHSNGGGYTLRLDFPADKFKQDELYRIYYVVYDDAQGLRYKGHGDFLIKDM